MKVYNLQTTYVPPFLEKSVYRFIIDYCHFIINKYNNTNTFMKLHTYDLFIYMQALPPYINQIKI